LARSRPATAPRCACQASSFTGAATIALRTAFPAVYALFLLLLRYPVSSTGSIPPPAPECWYQGVGGISNTVHPRDISLFWFLLYRIYLSMKFRGGMRPFILRLCKF
jgi:hypothetical protein